ncbi:hypothetical protein H1C71_037604, partial [Ictidomys tridecemlineatus]
GLTELLTDPPSPPPVVEAGFELLSQPPKSLGLQACSPQPSLSLHPLAQKPSASAPLVAVFGFLKVGVKLIFSFNVLIVNGEILTSPPSPLSLPHAKSDFPSSSLSPT